MKHATRRIETRAQAFRRKRIADLLQEAERALGQGGPGLAARASLRILKEDPNHLGALEIYAKALWQQRRWPALLSALDRLICLNPYEPGYHLLRALALECQGRFGEAVQAYARAGAEEQASASIEDLREWQSMIVADLLREDPVFQVQYARNPHEACRSRGFEFLPDRPVKKWAATEGSVGRPV